MAGLEDLNFLKSWTMRRCSKLWSFYTALIIRKLTVQQDICMCGFLKSSNIKPNNRHTLRFLKLLLPYPVLMLRKLLPLVWASFLMEPSISTNNPSFSFMTDFFFFLPALLDWDWCMRRAQIKKRDCSPTEQVMDGSRSGICTCAEREFVEFSF